MSIGTRLSDNAPLLSPADVESPLTMEEQVDAASILTQANQDPDDAALEAVGFYRRKELRRLMGSAAFNASGLAERIEHLDQRLPAEIQESDLLDRLITDLSEARLQTASSEKDRKLPDILGLRRRREQKERMHALREKASVREMIDITDLQEGDTVTLESNIWGDNESKLEGTVIGSEDSRFGPALLIKVSHEKHKGEHEFSYIARGHGAIARLIGTVYWNNSYRAHPSKVALNEVLQFLDAEGESFILGLYRSGTDRQDGPIGLCLTQLTVNGTKLFSEASVEPRSK